MTILEPSSSGEPWEEKFDFTKFSFTQYAE